MSFYNLFKKEREILVNIINSNIITDLEAGELTNITAYFADEDTYIRKAAYIETGKIYTKYPFLRKNIIIFLEQLLSDPDFKVRQTVINSAGEIGKRYFDVVEHFFDKGLFDEHHSPRNAVIGSIKKMGEKNPQPVLGWARKYLHHADKEVRREICHGIELRGRTHPQDILPMLKELQWDKTARVRKTLVHVIGQIAYKKGCLETVVADLLQWENSTLVEEAWVEILVIHDRYRNFSILTTAAAKKYIEDQIGKHLPYIT